MSLLFSVLSFLVLVIGTIRGFKAARNQWHPLHLGALTALVSIIGIAATLIVITLGFYSLATFDERAPQPAIHFPIARMSGEIMFYCFIGALIGNLLLFFPHKNTDQSA